MSLEREVGALQARMETVESELQGIRSDVREIRDALVARAAAGVRSRLSWGFRFRWALLLQNSFPIFWHRDIEP